MPAPRGETLLAEAIKSKQFDAVYALCGDNDFRKEEAVRQLVDSATDAATRDFNFDLLRGAEVDPQSLEVSLTAVPMMSENRIVVLRDAGSLKKPALAWLEGYVSTPSRGTVLVLLFAAGTDVPPVLQRRSTIVELEQLSGERLLKWITRQAKSAHGVEIEREAAELLHEVVGNDLLELEGELDKLCSFTEGRCIDTDAVTAVVGVRPGETIVALLESVAARDVRAALAIVPAVLRQPKVTGVTLVMSVAAQTLGIGWCRARRDEGASPSVLQRDGFAVARRVMQFMDPRAPSARIAAWVRASDSWTLADVNASLDALLAADIALKQTRFASEEQIVSTAVLAACAGGARVRSAA